MKEIPMIFQGWGVRAIGDETKTMTRRLKFNGQPGDRIWVRETWAPLVSGGSPEFNLACYQATDEFDGKWKPSIHMPRWASRYMLEVLSVREERVQDISEADAIAEGIEGHNESTGGDDYQDYWRDYSIKEEDNEGYNYFTDPISSFHSLWDSINAKPKPHYVSFNGCREVGYYISYPWEDIQERRVYRGKPWIIKGNPPVKVIEFRLIKEGV